MFGNMDPEKMKEVQRTSGLIRGEIRIDHKLQSINIAFNTKDEDAIKMLKKLIPSFAEALATQLGAFFNIKGEIVDVNKDA